MSKLNQNKTIQSSFVIELSLQSHDAFDIEEIVKGSMVEKFSDFDENWKIHKAFRIDNKKFNVEFSEKKYELQNKSSLYAYREVRYGFLATIRESMIHKVAEEGLEVRLCPYNYFGHSISGIHISQNADVCMKEASTKVGPGDEIILIIFKYILGKHKIVPMYDPEVLLAPTPNYDSHLCEDRPDPTEKIANQYIKSLVYLYEFENVNFDPTTRPRHCCPVAALVYRPGCTYNTIDFTDNKSMIPSISNYNGSPLSFYKPVSQSFSAHKYPLTASPPRGTQSIVIHKNDLDDSRKVMMSVKNDITSSILPRFIEQRNELYDQLDIARQGTQNDTTSSILPRLMEQRNERYEHLDIARQGSREIMRPEFNETGSRTLPNNYDKRNDRWEKIKQDIASQGDRERSRSRTQRNVNSMNPEDLVYRDRSVERSKPFRDCDERLRNTDFGGDINDVFNNWVANNNMPAMRDWFK